MTDTELVSKWKERAYEHLLDRIENSMFDEDWEDLCFKERPSLKLDHITNEVLDFYISQLPLANPDGYDEWEIIVEPCLKLMFPELIKERKGDNCEKNNISDTVNDSDGCKS